MTTDIEYENLQLTRKAMVKAKESFYLGEKAAMAGGWNSPQLHSL